MSGGRRRNLRAVRKGGHRLSCDWKGNGEEGAPGPLGSSKAEAWEGVLWTVHSLDAV